MKTLNTVFTAIGILALGFTAGCGGSFDDADALKTGGEAGIVGAAGAEPTTGGTVTGGSENTGETETGGTGNIGNTNTGGFETGGNSGTGGNVTGGVSTGGNITGGTETGGFATGGSTGGTETGGSATGGSAGTGGNSCSGSSEVTTLGIECYNGCIPDFDGDGTCYTNGVLSMFAYCNVGLEPIKDSTLTPTHNVRYGDCNLINSENGFDRFCCNTY